MPAVCETLCDACGDSRGYISGAEALQLDDGSLAFLRHPGESTDCEKHGLTRYQASRRGRLFYADFALCRRCGGESYKIRPLRRDRGLDEPLTMREAMFFCVVAAVLGVPFALWYGSQDLVVFFVAPFLLSPIVVVSERRKYRRRRQKLGQPVLPTPDSPGQFKIAPPRLSVPCCDQPNLIDAGLANDSDCLPCRKCGRRSLRVVFQGVA